MWESSLVVLAVEIDGWRILGRTEWFSSEDWRVGLWEEVSTSIVCGDGGGTSWKIAAKSASLGTSTSGRFAAFSPFLTSSA